MKQQVAHELVMGKCPPGGTAVGVVACIGGGGGMWE